MSTYQTIIILYIIYLVVFRFLFLTVISKRVRKKPKQIPKKDPKANKAKDSENKQIPAILWKSGPKMTDNLKKHFKKLELDNHPYKVRFIDDKSSRDIVKSFEDPRVLNAYDTLVPGAYKADLLRYVLLYKHGGVWSDLKHKMKFPIDKIVNRDEILVLTKDRKLITDKNEGVQISFMAAIPGLRVFHKAIYRVVDNVERRYYGENALCPTGPQMFNKVLSECEDINYIFVMKDCNQKLCHIDTDKILIYKDHAIAPDIPHGKYMAHTHYTHLWQKRKIYKNNRDNEINGIEGNDDINSAFYMFN